MMICEKKANLIGFLDDLRYRGIDVSTDRVSPGDSLPLDMYGYAPQWGSATSETESTASMSMPQTILWSFQSFLWQSDLQ